MSGEAWRGGGGGGAVERWHGLVRERLELLLQVQQLRRKLLLMTLLLSKQSFKFNELVKRKIEKGERNGR